jgi:dTDP-4-amino-4,6-dideoxygalactose transaminase
VRPAPAAYQYSTLTADQQIRLVTAAIASGEIGTFGAHHLPDLETAVAGRIGRREAIAVDSGSGSGALALAIRALGLGPDHEVIIPEIGWVSIGAAVADAGARVLVAPATEALMPEWKQIHPLITPATGAVVLAHIRGRAALGTARIAVELADRGIPLIEDCAQAWGVTADGRPAGAWGTLATFSVQTYKMIAVGEGGLLVGDDPDTIGLARALAGDTRQTLPQATWRGKRRMTEISAALALPQLDHLDTLTSGLRTLQSMLADVLADIVGPDAVLPAHDGIAASNGSIVGIWLPSPELARRAADALFGAGLRSWWPGPGDLHAAAAWPAGPVATLVDPQRYLDIQVPHLPAEQHKEFVEACATVIADVVDAA